MQHDFDITTADANTGATMRTQINAALQALATNSAATGEPGAKYPFMWWADATTDTLKQRNAGNTAWVNVLELSTGVAVAAAESATLGGSTLAQLLAAVPDNMPEASEDVAGKIELATDGEVAAGVDAGRAITPAGLASFAKSLAVNGYAKLPGGLILQWGTCSPSSYTVKTLFPIAFPSMCLNVLFTEILNVARNDNFKLVSTPDTLGFYVSPAGSELDIKWFAIGY